MRPRLHARFLLQASSWRISAAIVLAAGVLAVALSARPTHALPPLSSTVATGTAIQTDGTGSAEPAFLRGRVSQVEASVDPDRLTWSVPRLALRGHALRVAVAADASSEQPVGVRLRAEGEQPTVIWQVPPGGSTVIKVEFTETGRRRLLLETVSGATAATTSVRVVPAWWSLLPPLTAIVAAVLLRQVMVSLFLGLWLGGMFLYDFNPITALLRTLDTYVLGTLSNSGNANVLLYIMILGGTVGLIVRNGGTHGVIAHVVRWARTPRSGQLSTWVMGLLVFFDDYSNTLIVGNTMRPITDRLRISREKLAYLVDCTAAPVASVAVVSSWIGVEVGYIAGALQSEGIDRSAYLLFIESIPYRFYPILALAFAFLVGYLDRDFGPMLAAERRARVDGRVLGDDASPLVDVDDDAAQPPPDCPRRWYNAAVPIATVVVVTMIGLWWNGGAAIVARGGDPSAAAMYEILAAANPNVAILWGSFSGLLAAVCLTLGQRLLSLDDTMRAFVSGMKSVLMACSILVLAWSLKDICAAVHTADFLVEAVAGTLSHQLLPALVFLISAAIAFATGTSYGTMGILMPLVVPLAVRLGALAGLDAAAGNTLLVGAISSVLAGSVWGDHCSPISDTTILSSMASGSDHIDHVRTQIPYALLVGGVAMLLGDIPSGFGISPWLTYIVAIPALWAVLRYYGRPAHEPA